MLITACLLLLLKRKQRLIMKMQISCLLGGIFSQRYGPAVNIYSHGELKVKIICYPPQNVAKLKKKEKKLYQSLAMLFSGIDSLLVLVFFNKKGKIVAYN